MVPIPVGYRLMAVVAQTGCSGAPGLSLFSALSRAVWSIYHLQAQV